MVRSNRAGLLRARRSLPSRRRSRRVTRCPMRLRRRAARPRCTSPSLPLASVRATRSSCQPSPGSRPPMPCSIAAPRRCSATLIPSPIISIQWQRPRKSRRGRRPSSRFICSVCAPTWMRYVQHSRPPSRSWRTRPAPPARPTGERRPVRWATRPVSPSTPASRSRRARAACSPSWMLRLRRARKCCATTAPRFRRSSATTGRNPICCRISTNSVSTTA